jgi:hypothetical protein
MVVALPNPDHEYKGITFIGQAIIAYIGCYFSMLCCVVFSSLLCLSILMWKLCLSGSSMVGTYPMDKLWALYGLVFGVKALIELKHVSWFKSSLPLGKKSRKVSKKCITNKVW